MYQTIRKRLQARRAHRTAREAYRATEHLEPYLLRDAGLHRDPATRTVQALR